MTIKEVFPNLELPEELRAFFAEAKVTQLTMKRKEKRFRVYVTFPTWIKKEHIYRFEQELKSQVFCVKDAEVTVVERFRLSAQYTPENFYAAYRESMLLETREKSPLIGQFFSQTRITFPDAFTVRATVPENILFNEVPDLIKKYIEKVFMLRAGFSGIDIEAETYREDTKEYIRRDREKIARRVEEAARRRQKAEEEAPKAEKLTRETERGYRQRKFGMAKDPDMVLGNDVEGEITAIEEITDEPREVVIRGEVFAVETKTTRNLKVMMVLSLTDYTDSIRVKLWLTPEEQPAYEAAFRKGACFVIKGKADYDRFENEYLITNVVGIKKIEKIKSTRTDEEPVKRVELHCHTKMSEMDAVSSASSIIKQAMAFGMSALAITDHGVVQAFPEAAHTAPPGGDFKVIYGCEGYLVDDEASLAEGKLDVPVDGEMVAVSVAAAGGSPSKHPIIELAASKLGEGRVLSNFHTLINPEMPLPFDAQQKTGLTDSVLARAPKAAEAIAAFIEFAGGRPILLYDAAAESTFLREEYKRAGYAPEEVFRGGTVVDVQAVMRAVVPIDLKRTFEITAKKLKAAKGDAMTLPERADALALIYAHAARAAKKQGSGTFAELQEKNRASAERIKSLPYYHIILLAKNETGRVNLYRLVSESHVNYFRRRPRIPRSVLNKYREGIIVGSACSAGELYQAILHGKSDAELAGIVGYYDYLEVQPIGNNGYLVREKLSGITSDDDLRDINRRIVRLGELYKKPVAATCDVHFLNPEDAVYRSVIQASHGYKDVEQPPLYLHTTREMLDEFSYLGAEKAYEVVVENTNLIASWIGDVSPIYPDKCPPVIENSDGELMDMCMKKAKSMYGAPLPSIVKERLDKELGSIIKNGYAVMYIIAQRLVKKSNEDGYLVGSRGSVGSSFAATMADITEVNPLPPHYLCPECKYSDFDSETVKSFAGCCGTDMPDAVCPRCGAKLMKCGFDIPFETFLGFKGDKEPDIDLNFSGDEQSVAQAYTEVIFGKGQTFNAGTVLTVADKTAYSYTYKFFEDLKKPKRRCELERLAGGVEGVRSSTGQHPGGVIVVPRGMEINTFTPVQHPANKEESNVITTHFDYHSIDKNLLKLDILGHDDPTIIRMLKDTTGTEPLDVPLNDPGVLSLFAGTEALGISPDDLGLPLGVWGVPEFGTRFVMGMLLDAKPKTFTDLIRISGLSHGTDVWIGNAQEFIKNGDCTLSTAICTRDDIMLDLISWGVEPEHSFKIMESVRKGKGLKPDQEAEMKEHGVPDWYIESCKRIKYMFPKAHAAAYVMNAFRIAYYKINYPLHYYAAMFSVRCAFDYEKMAQGRDVLEENIRLLDENSENEKQSDTEKKLSTGMLLAREMYLRGYEFERIDLKRADPVNFTVQDGKIMPSITSLNAIGENAAVQISEAAKKGPFISKEDFKNRSRATATMTDMLCRLGILENLPETSQMSLFDIHGGGTGSF